MKSLITVLLLGLFISSQAQNISQSQVRQFNAVPAYRVFGRGAGVGTPSFITLDSNHVPQLHSQSYYDLRYGSLLAQQGKLDTSGTYINNIILNNSGLIHTSPATFNYSNHTATLTQSLANQSPYTILGRASGIGAPSFLTALDSNWIPSLHSQGYYDGRYKNNTISIYDFIIGDGGANTPVAGTTVYTNAALKGKAITSFKQAGIQLPLTPISGSAYAIFDSSNGTVTLSNSVFSSGSYYSVTTAGVGTFSGTIGSAAPYLVYSTLYSGLLSASTTGAAVSNVKQQLLSTDWNDDVRPVYVRFIGNFGIGINSNDVVELRVNDVTNSNTFSSATATTPYLFGTSSTNDPNAAVKVSTPWIAIPSSRIYVTFAAYNQTASRGSLTNLRMEVKYQ